MVAYGNFYVQEAQKLVTAIVKKDMPESSTTKRRGHVYLLGILSVQQNYDLLLVIFITNKYRIYTEIILI